MGLSSQSVPYFCGRQLAGEARCQPEACTKRYWSTNYIRLVHVSFTTVAVSTRPPTLLSEVAVQYLGAWLASKRLAVQYLGAWLAWERRSFRQDDIEEALAVKRRRRWAAWRRGAARRGSVILQRQFLQSSSILRWCLSLDSVRDGVLLVLSSVVHRDRYPQCFSWSSMSWERGCSMEACERISHFLVLLALFAWNLDVIPRAPCFWQPVHGCFLGELRQKVDSVLLAVHTWKSGIISTSSIWHRVRQSTLLLEEFHIFSSCWLSQLLCAVST